jgi:FKBP-type peptidyl-prolyl cis-trans isomerase
LYLVSEIMIKMQKNLFNKIWILAFLVPFLGCEEDVNYEAYMEEEDRYFQLYMDANYPDLEHEESGLYYIKYEEGTGQAPDSGDWVMINYLAYTIPDETVVDTYDEEWARDYNLYNSSVLYGPYKYQHGAEMEGLREGLSMMKEGAIARLIFKSDLGYGAEGLGNIGKFESLMYDVQLLKVIEDIVEWEQMKIDSFLADHPTAYPIRDDETDAVMYYIPGRVGDSALVAKGNNVEVFYTGQLLDGRVFDSNVGSASGMTVTVGEGDVIKGWDLGLKYFRYGGTGQLLIPHELAYGEEGTKASGTGKNAIPPYEALLFDIEVTKNVPETEKEKD